jgi:hypothetical protein
MNPYDNPLQKQIRGAQTYDAEVSQALESVLKNGPQLIIKSLEDWNLEDHRHIYIPKDDNL